MESLHSLCNRGICHLGIGELYVHGIRGSYHERIANWRPSWLLNAGRKEHSPILFFFRVLFSHGHYPQAPGLRSTKQPNNGCKLPLHHLGSAINELLFIHLFALESVTVCIRKM